LWERQWFVAVPVALLTLMLVAHGLMIQQRLYYLGFCQTRALETLKAVLKDTAPEAPRAVLIRDDDAPLWVIGVMFRAVVDNSFPLRGEFVKVSVTHDPDRAGMVFHPDCSVSTR
jgi:hypothetical protein